MSMEETAGGPVSGDTGPEVTGQPTEGAAPEPPAPARQYVEVDDPDDRYVRVKVAGEDVEVPFSEAIKGYSREADYTRKAQEAARLRQEGEEGLRVLQALEVNPAMTMQILADRYGIPLGQQQPEPSLEDEYADPLERAIAEERYARMSLEERLEQQEADRQLESAIGGLKTNFNLGDEDVREVIGVAYRMNLPVESFPMIWKTMAFDRLQARVQAARARDEQQAAKTQQRQTAAQQQAQLIGNGTGVVGTQQGVDSSRNMTIREAIEAAIEQVEGPQRI